MSNYIKVGISKKLKGIRCIVATKNIKAGTVIEKCPLILYPNKFDKLIAKTPMGKYDFEWNDELDCIVLGYGSLYNHSFEPNARYLTDYKNKLMIFKSLLDIKKGEEITINYNYDPDDKTPLDKTYLNYDKNFIYKKSK